MTRGGDYRSVWLGCAGLAVLAAVGLPVAYFLGGGRSLAGAAVGIAVVAVFFTLSVVAVTVAGRRDPQLMFPAAIGTYIVKIAVFGALLAGFDHTGWVDTASFAWVVVAGVLAWSGTGVLALVTTRDPYVQPGGGAGRGRPEGP